MNPIDEIEELFAGQGAADYLGEPVSQAEHMYQTGLLAQKANATDALIAAALLHDVGHFQGTVSGEELMQGTDNRHSHSGSEWLSNWFGKAVTEPVRLHVAAKRYLCAVEPEYFAQLSEASVYTLKVQGGPMTPEQIQRFEAEPYYADAIALRRWDDQAKDPTIETPGFEHFRPILERLLTT